MATHASRDVDMTTCVQINKMVANSKEQNSRSHCGPVWIRLQTLVARIDEKSAKTPYDAHDFLNRPCLIYREIFRITAPRPLFLYRAPCRDEERIQTRPAREWIFHESYKIVNKYTNTIMNNRIYFMGYTILQ